MDIHIERDMLDYWIGESVSAGQSVGQYKYSAASIFGAGRSGREIWQ